MGEEQLQADMLVMRRNRTDAHQRIAVAADSSALVVIDGGGGWGSERENGVAAPGFYNRGKEVGSCTPDTGLRSMGQHAWGGGRASMTGGAVVGTSGRGVWLIGRPGCAHCERTLLCLVGWPIKFQFSIFFSP
jgi:hypothetical protein